ncbi:G-protein-signaling modulator 1 [Liparis tanakae]|uniref:G-protein-signaling modulator 1 n=1 Tax=Liparis tanakae TaxID=230148 RepID=A0A4Z2G301_9TELE|nr:G-protein-signaling modulator 1 [Liparis tanakae]
MSGEGPLERLVITEEGDAAERVGEAEEEHAGEAEKATREDPPEDVRRLKPSESCSQSQPEDPKKAHRLTPEFPEALYELLCDLQEGRRLNDQRCSFKLEGGMGMRMRRCHSEPNASKPANRVVFSSMTSLQKEEFFELVATAQARRLDDQRSQLEKSHPPKPKSRGFRGSLKQLSFAKRPAPAPAAVPKEDLYNMILATQAQGRLEDQRSRAPGPMDDEDFFSLLLRVQGGRMEEQRTELPGMLQA